MSTLSNGLQTTNQPTLFHKSKMEVEGSSKKMIATQAEMAEARVPLPYRDQCANHLTPLNKCRVEEFYLPWIRPHAILEGV
ncbi:NADH dehydrogenase ubiquinone 1 beta subcomplex subunit 7 [Nymphaea thermarum]|nr:NADH dehydrogenase ubiquinone 1 beta subcomplex subunit 7 [Nymphaea thermarum]